MTNDERTTPLKVPDVWFDDGNLIILAGHKVFRLQKGLIARHSTIFSDMLAIPQPAGTNLVDDADKGVLKALNVDPTGCAVVRLTDDPDDVEWFLSAFLTYSLLRGQYTSNLGCLAGILRLATKYEVNFLRCWAASSIERLFPTDQDSLTNEMNKEVDTASMDGIFSLIDVALTIDMSWLLHGVYWRLRRASLTQILRHPQWMRLSDERRTAFILAHEATNRSASTDLFTAVLKTRREIPVLYPSHDRDNKWCTDGFQGQVMQILALSSYGGKSLHDPFYDNLWQRYLDNNACTWCKREIEHLKQQIFTDVYRECQMSFNLPDNDQLKEMRESFFNQVSEKSD